MDRKKLNLAAIFYYENKFIADQYLSTSIERAFIAGAKWREDQILNSLPQSSDTRLLSILDICCKVCYVSKEEAASDSRMFNAILCRQMYFFLARELTNARFISIGAIIARSHSSVIHGLSEVRRYFIKNDQTYLDTYNQCLIELEKANNELWKQLENE